MNAYYLSAGTQLAYSESGSGLPVIFLHPIPLDGDFWRPMIGNLGSIHAIVSDLRGHGASELGSGLPIGRFVRVPDAPALTMAQLADDVIALLTHLKIEKAVFAGCSIGGYILLELWRRHPERILGLAFVCSKPQPDSDVNHRKRDANIAEARSGNLAALLDGMAQTSIGATARLRRPAIVHELRQHMTLTSEAFVAVQAGLASRPDSVPTVSTIDVPVLAIAGGEDAAASPAEMEALRAARSSCEFHLLPDAGHFAAYEQPEKVASLFGPWLRQFAG